MAIRRGVLRVLADFRTAARSTTARSSGSTRPVAGPPATLGHDAQGRIMIPATTLHCLVAGIRHETPDGRDRLIAYLVENFEELVYV